MSRRRKHRRHHHRRNPLTRRQWMWTAAAVGGVGFFWYLASKASSAQAAQQLPPPPVTPSVTPTGTGQNYNFSTNNSGGSVTLNPGDSISFGFPNDPAAASSAMSDWFWTTAPLLSYRGRTTQTVGGQLQETDSFVYGGGAPGSMTVSAQFLKANNPALPTFGPNPPVAYAQPGASTFNFTITTT